MNMKFRAYLLLSLCHTFIRLCACMCVFAFVLLRFTCTRGFCVSITCLCCLLRGMGIAEFVCLPVQKKKKIAAKVFLLFTASCFSQLYIYFLREVFAVSRQKSLFTQWLSKSCLSRSLSRIDYGEIKTCRLAFPKSIIFVSEDVTSRSFN